MIIHGIEFQFESRPGFPELGWWHGETANRRNVEAVQRRTGDARPLWVAAIITTDGVLYSEGDEKNHATAEAALEALHAIAGEFWP